MKALLFLWNPELWDISELIARFNTDGIAEEHWSTNSKNIHFGEPFYLYSTNSKERGFIGRGHIASSKVFKAQSERKDIKGEIKDFATLLFTNLIIEKNSGPVISVTELVKDHPTLFKEWSTQTKSSGQHLSSEQSEILDLLWNDRFSQIAGIQADKFIEGGFRIIGSKYYERNQQARKACIEKYGYTCQVCNFSFEDTYGELGKQFIEVHHKNPIRNFDSVYEVDAVEDMIPMCSNCHSMIHRNGIEPNQIEELKVIVQKHKL